MVQLNSCRQRRYANRRSLECEKLANHVLATAEEPAFFWNKIFIVWHIKAFLRDDIL